MAEFETAQQWEDAWWAEVERARRMVSPDDGDAAARVAWTCMRARYGTPPPYAAAVVDARPYPREGATGLGGVTPRREFDAYTFGGVRPPFHIVERDEVELVIPLGQCDPRRGWLGRLLDRMSR